LTVTENVPVAVFPTLSVAVAVTVVVPIGNTVPLAFEYEMVTGLSKLSVAVAAPYTTVAPLSDVALTLTLLGTLNIGAMVSTTPALESAAPLGPRANRKPQLSILLLGTVTW
jgi:hypothetical protein